MHACISVQPMPQRPGLPAEPRATTAQTFAARLGRAAAPAARRPSSQPGWAAGGGCAGFRPPVGSVRPRLVAHASAPCSWRAPACRVDRQRHEHVSLEVGQRCTARAAERA